MQIVIDIPEEMYAQIVNENGIDTMLIPYKDIIKNGTPLPKGYGRLGDLDALAHKMCMADIGCLEPEEVAGLMLWFCDKAPTIIEADKERRDKE